MSEAVELLPEHDARRVQGGDGLLTAFNAAGVLESADVHVARRLSAIVGESSDEVALAVALAVRAARHGSVCVDLTATVESLTTAWTAAALPDVPPLPWPHVDGWLDRVADSALASGGAVRIEHGLLYLDRYWREEVQVCEDLLARAAQPAPVVDDALLVQGAERVFPQESYAEQRAAARAAVGQWTTVLTGGPGTGKTTTVAGLLVLLAEQSETPLRVALTAPTGKAAARLQESVTRQAGELPEQDRAVLHELQSQTLHRLLGWRPGSRTRFRHHRSNRLPHDVIVVDETSMVSLTMMARLLEAVRDDARLVLVGDDRQLASVEAGAVLGDLVGGLAERLPGTVVRLQASHRSVPDIDALAAAVRDSDADRVLELLRAGSASIEFLETDAPAAHPALRAALTHHALELTRLAGSGAVEDMLAALNGHRLLCAHRTGAYGVQDWNRHVESWLRDEGALVAWGSEPYPGRPLLVTANDYAVKLFNGDTGVVVRDPHDGLVAVIAGVGGDQRFAPSRLSDVETMHAMTVHKSQGSEVDEVTVLLPPEGSPLLTQELFYTALTRAKQRVRVVGTAAAVERAVRTRAERASGLGDRLRGAGNS